MRRSVLWGTVPSTPSAWSVHTYSGTTDDLLPLTLIGETTAFTEAPTTPDLNTYIAPRATTGSVDLLAMRTKSGVPISRGVDDKYVQAKLWLYWDRSALVSAAILTPSGLRVSSSLAVVKDGGPSWASVTWSIPAGTPDSEVQALSYRLTVPSSGSALIYKAYVELFTDYRVAQRSVV
jgi:hypothetical protein